MRHPELEELRALLRTQVLVEAEPAPRGLFGGMKALLKRAPPPTAYRPLNLNPVTPAAPREERSEQPAMTLTAEDHVPLLFVAPRRERFGLADDGPRPVSAEPVPTVALEPPKETPDDIEPRRPRNASLAATEAAGVGPDEILELQELLSARMPGLLNRIDLTAKLEEESEGDAPVIAAEVEAARIAAAEARAAWAEAGAALQARAQEEDPLPGPRLKLIPVEADLTAQQAETDGKLARVRRGRRRRALAA